MGAPREHRIRHTSSVPVEEPSDKLTQCRGLLAPPVSNEIELLLLVHPSFLLEDARIDSDGKEGSLDTSDLLLAVDDVGVLVEPLGSAERAKEAASLEERKERVGKVLEVRDAEDRSKLLQVDTMWDSGE